MHPLPGGAFRLGGMTQGNSFRCATDPSGNALDWYIAPVGVAETSAPLALAPMQATARAAASSRILVV